MNGTQSPHSFFIRASMPFSSQMNYSVPWLPGSAFSLFSHYSKFLSTSLDAASSFLLSWGPGRPISWAVSMSLHQRCLISREKRKKWGNLFPGSLYLWSLRLTTFIWPKATILPKVAFSHDFLVLCSSGF